MKKKLCLLLCFALLLSGCGSTAVQVNLMQGYRTSAAAEEAAEITEEGNLAAADFSIKLLQNSFEPKKNVLLSPVSVLMALGMTANGADGETLKQMEDAFSLDLEQLNPYLLAYRSSLPEGMHMANGIWFKDDSTLSVKADFLQENANWYNAGAYRAPFDDSTLAEINEFVDKNTAGKIPEIIERIPEDAVMYLVNALSFDKDWYQPYTEYQIQEGVFTTENGTAQTVNLMYSEEYGYFSDEKSQGFVKYFKDRQYAFAAILPNEETTVSEYLTEMSGEKLLSQMKSLENIKVETALPEFKTEYGTELSQTLKALGITDAFDSNKADFMKMGTSENGPLYISSVIHKTFMEVGAQGVSAGAATVVEMAEGAALEIEEPKRVYLDRPFLYLLIDCQNNVPIFIGTMMDMG